MAFWIGKDGNYNVAANWRLPRTSRTPRARRRPSPSSRPNGASTSVTLTASGQFDVGGFTFDVAAPTYTITLAGAGAQLTFHGAGIVNNSSVAQNLSTGSGVSHWLPGKLDSWQREHHGQFGHVPSVHWYVVRRNGTHHRQR